MPAKKKTDEVLIDVGDEDEKAVDIELDDKGESTITEVDNPNVDDQLDATGETTTNEDDDKRTPQQRVDEYLEQNEEAAKYSRDVTKRINKFKKIKLCKYLNEIITK